MFNDDKLHLYLALLPWFMVRNSCLTCILDRLWDKTDQLGRRQILSRLITDLKISNLQFETKNINHVHQGFRQVFWFEPTLATAPAASKNYLLEKYSKVT